MYAVDKKAKLEAKRSMGKFFYDLAKASFTTIFVAGFVSFAFNQSGIIALGLMVFGLLSTILLAVVANVILNSLYDE